MPNGGPAPPLRDAPYGVATEAEARAAVRELAAKKIDGYVKIWVDDRDGTVKKLTPELYAAAIDEAHKVGLRTITHTQDREDVKASSGPASTASRTRHGGGARKWMTSCVGCSRSARSVFVMLTLWGTRNQIFGRRPAWIDDPLLRETFTDDDIAAARERECSRRRGRRGGRPASCRAASPGSRRRA